MDTFTSFTYSFQKQNDMQTKKIEYISTMQDNDKVMSTYYNNMYKNNEQSESFNKLLKDNHNIYEQVGNSLNKSNWTIKEFHNQKLNKEYNDKYDKHTFEYVPSVQSIENNQFLLNL